MSCTSPPCTAAQNEVLVDVQDANQGVFDGRAGDVRILGASGAEATLRISGEGRNLGGGQDVMEERLSCSMRTRRPSLR